MPRSPRKTINLSEPVHHRLNMYALAATAAGVGMLNLPAEGKIVYTPANVQLQRDVGFPLDLNHDGKVDFFLFHYPLHTTTQGLQPQTLLACHNVITETRPICYSSQTHLSNSLNGIRVIQSKGFTFGAALPRGAKIQRGDSFKDKTAVAMGGVAFPTSLTHPTFDGPWMNNGKGVKNRYLGIRFKIKGRFHFGWARLSVTTQSTGFTATLTGYAYETVPRMPIIAGKTKGPDAVTMPPDHDPLGLGRLALGRK